MKEGSGLGVIFDNHQLTLSQLEDDIEIYLCGELVHFDNNMETYYGFFKICNQFSKEICEQIYNQIIKDIDFIDSHTEYSHKAYGYTKKSSLFFFLSALMLNIRHDLHSKALNYVLDKIKDNTEVKYPIQKHYTTILLVCIKNCIMNEPPKTLKLKNKVFTEVFTLLSHKFDSVNKAALCNIDIIKQQEGCSKISEIIASRHGVFWANIFSYIKYIDLLDSNTMKISLIFKSLKTYGYQNFKENLEDVLNYLGQAIDHFVEFNDWNSLMVIFELASVTSEIIHDHCTEEDKKYANGVKNFILRIKQFFTATRNKKLVHTSCEIFKNCVPYLSKVGFELEEAKNFSDEDPQNTVLSNGLGILAHKFYADLLYILKQQEINKPIEITSTKIPSNFYEKPGFNNISNQISVLRLLREINKYSKDFLTIGHRYQDIFDFMLEFLSSYSNTSSSLQNKLAVEYLQFYNDLKQPENTEDEQISSLTVLKEQVKKVELLLNPMI